jgi:hypothetical protein
LDGLKNADGSYASWVVPAKSYDANSSVTYLLSSSPNGGNGLTLWSVDTKKLVRSASRTVPTTSYSQPPQGGAPQPGTTTKITIGDARLINAVYQPSSGLWTVHTTGCPGDATLSCFTWHQLDPVNGAIYQEGSFSFTNSYVYAPAVAVNRAGNAAFVFHSSDSNHFVSIYGVGRDGGDPPGTLQGDKNFLIKAGVDIYTRGAPASHGWADVDPTNDNQFWVVGAYPSGNVGGQDATCPDGSVNHDWQTEVGQLSFTGPPSKPPSVGYYMVPNRSGGAVVPQ